MEDENEWPYLVWETKDNKKREYASRPETLDMHVYDIPFSQFPSYLDRLGLTRNQKINLVNSIEVRPRNCTFSIHKTDDIRFNFKVKNEYLTTEINVLYDSDSGQLEYIGGYTSHDGLESMQWFRDIVRQIETENDYKFEFCYRGHDSTCREGKLRINEDYETLVMFEKNKGEEHYGYKLDFAGRKLEFYHEYPFHEYYMFF